MRLYLNTKEAKLIYLALSVQRVAMNDEQKLQCDAIQDRMTLCEKLQRSENKAKEE